MSNDQIRLLSLDGGGVRGLSSLLILEQLMRAINPESPPEPHECFDLIGGTSTGGLIAVMLGRLQMSIQDCIVAYTSLSADVFEKKRSRLDFKGRLRGRFDSDALEKSIKKTVKSSGLDENALLKDPSDPRCKVFVCAASKETSGTVCLRSYSSARAAASLFNSTAIWQACRATSAATTFFDPIAIGPFGQEFVDAALGKNNPIYSLWTEAQDIWGDQLTQRLGCIVSIGTGVPPLKGVRDNALGILGTLQDISTETEKTAEVFARDKSNLKEDGRYYRFNVPQGLEDVGLEEASKKRFVASATDHYTESQTVQSELRNCAKALGATSSSRHQNQDPKDQDCLRDLLTTNPYDDKDRIEEVKGGLLKDVIHWALESGEFRCWQTCSRSSLLWIRGEPGKGKTMLVCGIINELTHLHPNSTVSFFFCQADDDRCNKALSVLRGLIYGLIGHQPRLISHVRSKYDLAGKRLFDDRNAWSALSKIFRNMLSDPLIGDICLVIDALDECRTDLILLLGLISSSSAAFSRVKWILSSRNTPLVNEHLNTIDQRILLSLDHENEEFVSNAVTKYIQYKVDEVASHKALPEDIQVIVKDRILRKSGGTFLWVALAFRELDKTPSWRIQERLDTFPASLSAFYDRMMEDTRDSDGADLCVRILAIVLVVRRPITLDELASLDALDGLLRVREQLPSVIQSCGSFLSLRNSTVTFIHQSAAEFLRDAPYRKFPCHFAGLHRSIFSHCLWTMSRTLRRDVYDLKRPGRQRAGITTPVPDPLSEVKYACIYWFDHLESGASDEHINLSTDQIDDLNLFLTQSFLHWIEALGILGGLFEGTTVMVRLEKMIQTKKQAHALYDRVRDASRFIRYSRPAVERAPLQVYYSALLFSPKLSFVSVNYRREKPGWLLNTAGIPADWEPCLQTLKSSSKTVVLVAWSPDERLASVSHKEEWINIWDLVTGRRSLTLTGHTKEIEAIAWSHTGGLASGSDDCTLKIWDSISGKCLRTLTGHAGSVTEISWSGSNDGILASACEDKRIRTWNTATGQCLSELDVGNEIRSMSWSPNGSQIAFTKSCAVMTWQQSTGEVTRILEDNRPISHIAWSPDGQRLACLKAGGHIVNIWSIDTGYCVSNLRGHSLCIFSMAWSKSGVLATVSQDNTVKLWIPQLEWCTATLSGHANNVLSVIWSPDGNQLASGSVDGSMRVWDATQALESSLPAWSKRHVAFITEKLLETIIWSIASQDWTRIDAWVMGPMKLFGLRFAENRPLIHSDNEDIIRFSVRCLVQLTMYVAIKPFGLFLVTYLILCAASSLLWENRVISAWQPADYLDFQLRQRASENKTTISLSPEKKRLALDRKGGSVQIWPLTGDKSPLVLAGGHNSICNIEWSPDGKLIASASKDGAIRISDAGRGTSVSLLPGTSPWVYILVWSRDMRRLATCSITRVIQVWEIRDRRATLTYRVEPSVFARRLEFDSADQDVLHTNFGTISISSGQLDAASGDHTTPPSVKEGADYDLSDGEEWITCDGENLLWLPHEYRYGRTTLSGSIAVINVPTGSVIIMDLSKDGPWA